MKNLVVIILLQFLFLYNDVLQAQWVQTNGAGGYVKCFAINGINIFAGIEGGGVYLSTNNGTNWTQVNNGLTYGNVISLAISDTDIFAGTNDGVFLSTNNGTDWTHINGLSGIDIYSLAVSGNYLYAGGYQQIFLSTNNGTNWTQVFSGSGGGQVSSIVISGKSVFKGSLPGGVAVSTDNGQNWTPLNNGFDAGGLNIFSIAVMGTEIFAGTADGIYLSKDNGLNWVIQSVSNPVFSIAVIGNNVFAGTNLIGIYLSTNNGVNWVQENNGLTNLHIQSLAICGGNIFAGTNAGVWKRPLSDFFTPPLYTMTLVNDVQTDSMHYEFDIYLLRTGTAAFELGSCQMGFTFNDAIKNGGYLTASWVPGSVDPVIVSSGQQNTNFDLTTSEVIKIAPVVAPSGPGTGAIISNVTPGTKIGRLRLSNSIPFASLTADIKYCFTTTPYRTEIAAYVPAGGGGTITDITDSTKHFNNLSNPALPVELSSFASIVMGRDVSLNWETKTENSDKFNIERKTIGTDWGLIGSVKAPVLNNSPKQYSFTDKNLQSGKYQYRLKMIDNDGTFEYSNVIETEVTTPKNFELSQNFPNPWNPTTKINYNLPNDSRVTLEVYNITGARVSQLVNEEQSAGYYSVDFGSSNLSSGVYFYRITAMDRATGNNFSAIKKMILLK
jgi:photosystem II stability/assembly factor-like uncharacterized protein